MHRVHGKSGYTILLEDLMRERCNICKGLGYVTDAEDGDIWFNEYVCEECRGTGLKNEIEDISDD